MGRPPSVDRSVPLSVSMPMSVHRRFEKVFDTLHEHGRAPYPGAYLPRNIRDYIVNKLLDALEAEATALSGVTHGPETHPARPLRGQAAPAKGPLATTLADRAWEAANRAYPDPPPPPPPAGWDPNRPWNPASTDPQYREQLVEIQRVRQIEYDNQLFTMKNQQMAPQYLPSPRPPAYMPGYVGPAGFGQEATRALQPVDPPPSPAQVAGQPLTQPSGEDDIFAPSAASQFD